MFTPRFVHFAGVFALADGGAAVLHAVGGGPYGYRSEWWQYLRDRAFPEWLAGLRPLRAGGRQRSGGACEATHRGLFRRALPGFSQYRKL